MRNTVKNTMKVVSTVVESLALVYFIWISVGATCKAVEEIPRYGLDFVEDYIPAPTVLIWAAMLSSLYWVVYKLTKRIIEKRV